MAVDALRGACYYSFRQLSLIMRLSYAALYGDEMQLLPNIHHIRLFP